MRYIFIFVFSLSLLTTAHAEIKIRVLDPQNAAIPGAQVQLFQDTGKPGSSAQTTNAEGLAVFHTTMPLTSYHVRILAPGFAEAVSNVPPAMDTYTVQMQLATAAETVVVTATRTPVPSQDSGASVDALNHNQLELIQPVAADGAIRFLPGAVINTAGQRGGLSSLFVRGGDSTYNKVIVDGVTVNEPGGTFDFGTLPLDQVDRLEFSRGAQSALYGTDAMTSVIQIWTRPGTTHVPDFTFGADGGNFSTAHGYASLAGARGPFDYNFFGDQFNTNGQGINTAYSDSLEGLNVGAALGSIASLRFRLRHSNTHTGVPGEWNFNGYDPLVTVNGALQPLQPDPSEWSQLNSLIGSVELTVNAPSGWQHRFTGFDYNYRYQDLNVNGDDARVDAFGYGFDFSDHEIDHINRAGFEYQGDYSERSWTHSTFGYRVENENGFIGDVDFPPQTHGQRLINEVYGQQQITFHSLTAEVGARYVHNSAFGNIGTPRVALSYLLLRGGPIFSGTRLRFSYATGFKEPRLEETFAGPPYTQPNPNLLPERNRAFDGGFQQDFVGGKYVLTGTYFNNQFHDQINYVTINPVTFVGEYVNVNKAFAQGAEVGVQARFTSRLSLNSSYTYTSTQILDNPAPVNSLYNVGMPLLRRPKNSATTLLTYIGSRWGANLGGSFVGPRPDSDFLGFNIDHAAGYVRLDAGGWFAIQKRIVAYANVENLLDRRYQEVVGYPALGINFRAGLRFRIGGD